MTGRDRRALTRRHRQYQDMARLDYRIANNAFDMTVYHGVGPGNPIFPKVFQQNYDQEKEDTDKAYGVFERPHRFKKDTIKRFAEHVSRERQQIQGGRPR